MAFVGALAKLFVGYKDFKGKTKPSEFYFGIAWLVIFEICYWLIEYFALSPRMMGADASPYLQYTGQIVLDLAIFLPTVAIVARRLNDAGRPRWLAKPLALSLGAYNLLHLASYLKFVFVAHAPNAGLDGFGDAEGFLTYGLLFGWIITTVVTLSTGKKNFGLF